MKITTVLNLGAGVQSSVLALMLDRNYEGINERFPKPDLAIFADTGWEPKAVYKHLDWLMSELSFPVEVVNRGNIRKNLNNGVSAKGFPFIDIPVFVKKKNGEGGLSRRQCTGLYKIYPIEQKIRQLAGAEKGQRYPVATHHANCYLGISIDEAHRMKNSGHKWQTLIYPLVDLRMRREDCLNWWHRHYPNRSLPRSACVICPYKSKKEWKHLKDQSPSEWQEAVEFDRKIRSQKNIVEQYEGEIYLHSSLLPLDQGVDKDDIQDAEQADMFGNECEGMCGV